MRCLGAACACACACAGKALPPAGERRGRKTGVRSRVRRRIQRESLCLLPRACCASRFPVIASALRSRACSCRLFSVRRGTVKMVNVLKGVLVECDPAMKQFLLYLDESNALGKKFIIQDLDETHVFVLAELVNFLQERVGELMDQNSFPITQK